MPTFRREAWTVEGIAGGDVVRWGRCGSEGLASENSGRPRKEVMGGW
jgi:hypothetical protein